MGSSKCLLDAAEVEMKEPKGVQVFGSQPECNSKGRVKWEMIGRARQRA